MLETVDFSREPLSKDAYKARRDELMERLVVLQQQARVQGVGLVVLFKDGTAPARAAASPISCTTSTRAPPACTSLKTST